MRLAVYAKQMGVTYKTAYRWYKAGILDAYQLPTGTIVINSTKENSPASQPQNVALYARVSSNDQKADLDRQLDRLGTYACAKGYSSKKEVKETASGLNDNRPKLAKRLADTAIQIIIVEHKDRLTRFGFNYISQLLIAQHRKASVIFPTDTDNEPVDDFVAVITSMSARIYRKSRRSYQTVKATQITGEAGMCNRQISPNFSSIQQKLPCLHAQLILPQLSCRVKMKNNHSNSKSLAFSLLARKLRKNCPTYHKVSQQLNINNI